MVASTAIFKNVSAASPTVTGNQTIAHGLGASPKFAFYTTSSCTTAGTAANHTRRGFGCTDGTNQWTFSTRGVNGNVGAADDAIGMTDQVISTLLSGSTGVDGEAAHVSWDATNHTINWGNAPASAFLMNVLFGSGADMSAYTSKISLTTQDTAITATSGWQPNAAIVISSIDTWNDIAVATTRFSIGFMAYDGTTTAQMCYAFTSQDAAATTEKTASILTDRVGGIINLSDVFAFTVEGAFTATGATFTPRSAAANCDIGVLLLKLDNCVPKVSNLTLPITGDLSGGTYSHNVGVAADFVAFLGSKLASTGTSSAPSINTGSGAGGMCLGFGVKGSTQENSISYRAQDAVTTTVEQSLQTAAIISMMPNGSNTPTHTGTINTIVSPNLNISYTATPAANNDVGIAMAVQLSTASSVGQILSGKTLKGLTQGRILG